MRAGTNVSILGALSRLDGRLLKADVPIRSVDYTWLQRVYNTPGPAAAELWSTTTVVKGLTYGVVMAAAHTAPIAPSLAQLHLPSVGSMSWPFRLLDTGGERIQATPIGASGLLLITFCSISCFCFTRKLCQIALSPLVRGFVAICHRPLGAWHPKNERKLTILSAF